MSRFTHIISRHAAALILTSCVITLAHAEPPQVNRLFPLGGTRGTSVEVQLYGKLPEGGVQFWTHAAGLSWEPIVAEGKKDLYRVSIDSNAEPGVRFVRVFDGKGASKLLRFVIGTLPETNESEPNDALKQSQTIEADPILINGVLQARNDVDLFRVKVKAGSTLVASVNAHRDLASPLDACLQIIDLRGNVLRQNLDAFGLDPMTSWTAKEDAEVIVRVYGYPAAPDSTISFAGGEDYAYRLTLSSSTSGDSAMATDNTKPVTDLPRFTEDPSTPASTPDAVTPTAVTPPILITGRIEARGEVDAYVATFKKDEAWRLRVQSRSLGHELDPVLTISDSSGKQLQRIDDVGQEADPSLVWKVPADGDYVIRLFDLHRRGGESFLYRLWLELDKPELVMRTPNDLYKGKVGEPLELAISLDRRGGFAEPVTLKVTGLPDTITCQPVTSESTGDSAKSLKLKLEAKEAWSGPVQIETEPAAHRVRTQTTELDQIWITIDPA